MKRLIVGLLAAATLTILSARADHIHVSGNVSGTWSTDTVFVDSTLNVPTGQSLTIEPGVKVIFQGHYKFIVNGLLEALGIEEDSIRFTAVDTTAGWWGIRFIAASDSSRLEYCRIEYGNANGSGNDAFGGGITCEGSSPSISYSTIKKCLATWSGGGIASHYNSNPRIENCMLVYNQAAWSGGGIYSCLSNPYIINCLIAHSTASEGAAIAANNSDPHVQSCTLSEDSASCVIRLHDGADMTMIDCIIWNNTGSVIGSTSSSANIAYSDIQGSWPGTGNINEDPLFVSGYHLSQPPCQIDSSPCVNAGDPASSMIIGTTRTDGIQDSGIVDMGYHYPYFNLTNITVISPNGGENWFQGHPYNIIWSYTGNISSFKIELYQNGNLTSLIADNIPAHISPDTFSWTISQPPGAGYKVKVSDYLNGAIFDYSDSSFSITQSQLDVTLTPINPPIIIPAQGASFEFIASVINHGPNQAIFWVWARMRDPYGTYVGPTLGPVPINPPINLTVSRMRTQSISGTWPAGISTYLGYANWSYEYPAIDSSSFTFAKSISASNELPVWETVCTGEPFPGEEIAASEIHPSSFALHPPSPNPFNASTVISYELCAASYVSLQVYDISGRLVATLVDGWTPAGTHRATFDGSGLAAGIYLVKLEAGEFTAVQKMVLLK